MKTTFKIEGISCPSCIASIRKAVGGDGVRDVRVDLDDGLVLIEHEPRLPVGALIERLERAGYPAAAV